MEMIIINNRAFSAKIYLDEKQMACVEKYVVTEKRDIFPVYDYDKSATSHLVCASISYEIELTKIEPYSNGISDNINLRELDNFDLYYS